MILSPAIIQSSVSNDKLNEMHEKNVQETLQTFLSTTTEKYSYRTGSNYVDAIAQGMGVNTTKTDGLYAVITNHILGKQQYHKTYAQLITEDLATQYKITINDTSFFLNPFSLDAHEELANMIAEELRDLLPYSTSFNCTILWQPIHAIPFGGSTFVGEPIPSTISTYSSYQRLSMPFLPRVTYSNSSFYFSSFHLKQLKDNILTQVPSLKNISYFQNQTSNMTYDQRYNHTFENFSSFVFDFFINGLWANQTNLLYPSVLDIVTSYLFSKDMFYHINYTPSTLADTSFHTIDSLLESFKLNQSDQTVDITNTILSSFGDALENQLYGITLSAASHFIEYIKQTIIDLLQPVLQPIIYELTNLLLSSKETLTQLFDSFIDLISSYLSVSEATISLTVWRG